jgi:hypothetical protein
MALTTDFITTYRVDILSITDQKLLGFKDVIYPIGTYIFNTNAVISIEQSSLFSARYETKADYVKEIKDLKDLKNKEIPAKEIARQKSDAKSSYYYMNISGARHIIDSDGLNSLQKA